MTPGEVGQIAVRAILGLGAIALYCKLVVSLWQKHLEEQRVWAADQRRAEVLEAGLSFPAILANDEDMHDSAA